MGIINPIKAAVEEFKNSVCLTEQLTKKIVEQDKDGKYQQGQCQRSQKRDSKTKGKGSTRGTTENIRR